jgi:hypothetical protein
MSKRFLLFGEKPFDVFAREKFAEIAKNINKMSDIEVIMYKDHFYELIKKTLVANMFKKLEISFENQVVDLVGRPIHMNTRYFAEYSVVVTGDTYFLGLSPYNSGYRPVEMLIEVTGNVMSFEIDTYSFDEELQEDNTLIVKKEYDRVKRYITNTLENLNTTIEHYNRELERFIIPVLADKLRKAEKCLKIKDNLNFK